MHAEQSSARTACSIRPLWVVCLVSRELSLVLIASGNSEGINLTWMLILAGLPDTDGLGKLSQRRWLALSSVQYEYLQML